MLLETCLLYVKIIKVTKSLQNIRSVSLLFFFSLSLTHFGPIFSGDLEISVFWGAYSNQSVYFVYQIKWLVFLLAVELRGNLDFGGTLAQIGLMCLLVLLLYCISKDVIKS